MERGLSLRGETSPAVRFIQNWFLGFASVIRGRIGNPSYFQCNCGVKIAMMFQLFAQASDAVAAVKPVSDAVSQMSQSLMWGGWFLAFVMILGGLAIVALAIWKLPAPAKMLADAGLAIAAGLASNGEQMTGLKSTVNHLVEKVDDTSVKVSEVHGAIARCTK
jgi:hypothetical protein